MEMCFMRTTNLPFDFHSHKQITKIKRKGASSLPNRNRRIRVSLNDDEKENSHSSSTATTTQRKGTDRKAKLVGKRKQRATLVASSCNRSFPVSEFLRHPSGVESVLNRKALQTFQPLEDPHTYRCTLHTIHFMSFEVVPVIDLRLTHKTNGCTVEMLSCKFEGSQALQQQNDQFSAFMRNDITWEESSGSEACVDFDVYLGVTLQVYTKPFTLLPLSAVETPGNIIMQGLVDRLVPLLVDQLLEDYKTWVNAEIMK